MPHLRIQDLSVTYGSRPALRDISLDIPDTRIVAVIGPSGCGKTTLLKSLNRLLDLQDDVRVTGRVLIDGEDIYAPGADLLGLRKKVGFLSQRPYPLPMSIFDNIAFGPRIHGLDGNRADLEARVERHLRQAGLWDEVADRLRAPAARLSIGQQQRLALARTLAVEPEVVLLDEPTSALDPISAKLVEQQFQTLKQDYTLILVTHILRQARRLADYVVFLYLGELIEHGPAQDFFSAPRTDLARAYVQGEIS